MVRQCRANQPQLKGVNRMSYSDYWRSEFLARHPEYESQPKVHPLGLVESSPSSLAFPFSCTTKPNTAPSTASNFAFPLFDVFTTNFGSSELLPPQESVAPHDTLRGHSTSLSIVSQVCCLRQRLQLTQRDLAKHLGISFRTLQDWEQGRRQPSGPGRALMLRWIERHAQSSS